MPHALLLSPDDQAVSAITAVLEEMSVTCERPLDGPSAAKKLTSQSFDLVLVDCENLPAAKLIFDVCRRSQTGTNPVPIAIVDGRAGLPTAFRLGAELILTKPVAKDQARTTIRTAVSRVRKDEPARTIQPIEAAHAEIAAPAEEALSHAAAAGAVSSPASVPNVPVNAEMSFAVEEIATARELSAPKTAASLKPVNATASLPSTDMFMPPSKAAPAKPSDDPVLADLESDTPSPVLSSYVEPREKKTSGALVTVLALAMAGGGLYAAWMYVPQVRQVVQPQIDRVITLIENASGSQPAPAPRPAPPVSAPVTQPVASAPAPASGATVDAGGITAPAPADAATQVSPTTPAPIATPAAATTVTATPTPDASKTQPAADPKKSTPVEVAALPEAELPGEKSAVILSSQGAEKRLLRHVEAVYPAEARKSGVEGTVVLKTVVGATGAVEGVRLVEGNPALAAAAISSVKQWHYRPYLRDGKAQPFQTIVLVDFQRP